MLICSTYSFTDDKNFCINKPENLTVLKCTDQKQKPYSVQQQKDPHCLWFDFAGTTSWSYRFMTGMEPWNYKL